MFNTDNSTSDFVCRTLHRDDWNYIKEGEMWCPHCKRMRKG